jgi:hypothetical protein
MTSGITTIGVIIGIVIITIGTIPTGILIMETLKYQIMD